MTIDRSNDIPSPTDEEVSVKVVRIELIQGDLVNVLRQNTVTQEMEVVFCTGNDWRILVEEIRSDNVRFCTLETQDLSFAKEFGEESAKALGVEFCDLTGIQVQ